MNDENYMRSSLRGYAKAAGEPVCLQSRARAYVAIIATLIALLPTMGVKAQSVDQCMARQGRTSIIDEESRFHYKRKLFLTPDEVARYVFLTNRPDDGDRSAAIYRVRGKKGALPGDYWLTSTVAANSETGDRRNIRVRRFDAPLPASTAVCLHDLWLQVLMRLAIDEEAIPSAPTGVLSVTTPSGTRLTGVTFWLGDEKSFCLDLLNLGGSLINYAKLPEAKRREAAAEIEKETRRLLKRSGKS